MAGARERLIHPVSVVLLVVDDWVLGGWIAELVDLGLFRRTDGKPVLVNVRADPLALVEEPLHTMTEHIAAKVGGQLLVKVDVIAVRLHTLDAGGFGRLGHISLGCVGTKRRPGPHRQGDLLGNLGKQRAAWCDYRCLCRSSGICGVSGDGDTDIQSLQQKGCDADLHSGGPTPGHRKRSLDRLRLRQSQANTQ